MKIKTREQNRKTQLLSHWQQRPVGQRTEKDVPAFYGDMERTFPHLISRRGGDSFQNLESDLAGHIEQRKRW